MKIVTRTLAAVGVAVALVVALPTMVSAGPSALSPSPHHVKLTASGCCSYATVTLTNTSSSTIYLRATPTPFGTGWNGAGGTCFMFTPLAPNDSCAVGLSFAPVDGPGRYPGDLVASYSLHNDLSTNDGSAHVRLLGRGVT